MHASACIAHPDYSELLSELVSVCIWFESIKSLGSLVGLVLFLQFTQDVMRCIQQLLHTLQVGTLDNDAACLVHRFLNTGVLRLEHVASCVVRGRENMRKT
jgi:hypothetical protein